ncbi:MAG: potassium channel family protein [Candidatus Nanoarchaeia archaeon]
MRIIIVGAGETGKALTKLLTSSKHEVTLVENDEETANSVAEDTEALVIKGDGTQISVLQDAGLDKSDAIIAATHDDKANFLICQIAKTTKVKKIISTVSSPNNEELFTKLGIKALVPIVALTITKIQQMLSSSDERIVAEFGGGNVEVVELTISEKSKLIGKPTKLPGAVIGTIYRDGNLRIPTEKTTLKEGDVLILTAKAEDMPKIRKKIEGE